MPDNLLKKLRQRLQGQLKALDKGAMVPMVREARKMQIQETLEWIDAQMKAKRCG